MTIRGKRLDEDQAKIAFITIISTLSYMSMTFPMPRDNRFQVSYFQGSVMV